jgi:hypothetical protein
MASKTFFVACAVATAAVGIPTALGVVSEYVPVPSYATILIPALLCVLTFLPRSTATKAVVNTTDKKSFRASAVCERMDTCTVECEFVAVVRVSVVCEAIYVATVEATLAVAVVRVAAVCERTDAATVEVEFVQPVIEVVRVAAVCERTDVTTVEAKMAQIVRVSAVCERVDTTTIEFAVVVVGRVSVVCERSAVVAVGEAFLAARTFRVNAACARGVSTRTVAKAFPAASTTSITLPFVQKAEKTVIAEVSRARDELDWSDEEEEEVVPKRVVISSVVQRACRVAADSCSISSPVRSRASSICSTASKENAAIFGVEVSDIADSWGVECTTPKSTPPSTPTKRRGGLTAIPQTPVSAPRAVLSPLRGLPNGSSPALTPNRSSNKARGTPSSGKKGVVGTSATLNYGGVANGW